jgi:Leucine-rich repeat (LRR) protein
LLPDGFSKDGAIAILDQHPRNPGNWIGVEDASPEGFILKLDLTGNQLTGPIPTELGLLTKLRELYLHNNKLTGQIPTELGLLTQLKTLSLSENQLTGAIPLELGRLTELRELYLHNNKLTGPTPSEIIKNRIYVSR